MERTGSSPSPGPPPPTPFPTRAPTSPSVCSLFLGLLDNEVIQDNQSITSPDDSNLKLEQCRNGNLAIRDGGNVIWESRQNKNPGDHWTKLQGDGNLVTRPGRPDDNPRQGRIWKSNSPSPSTDYFLGLDCSRQKVAIYRGRPDNHDGTTIWEENTY